jgi:hypothetical protein
LANLSTFLARANPRGAGAQPLAAWRGGLIIAAAALAFHVLGAALVADLSLFPSSLDEIQHLSYLRWMAHAPALFPHFEAIPTLDDRATHWTAAPNYLNHPSPYYLALGGLDRLLGGSVAAMRLVNIALSGLAVAIMLRAGFTVLRTPREQAVFAAFLVLFPKMGVVAGIVSNDNAALLATAVVFAGLLRWHATGRLADAALLAAGLALCGWTKFTVFLMAGFAVAIAELPRLKLMAVRPRLARCAVIALGAGAGAVPTLENLARYGRPLFHPTNFFTPVAERTAVSFADYAALFFQQMAITWSAREPARPLEMAGLAGVLAILGLTVVLAARRARAGEPLTAPWIVALGFGLALPPTLALHLWFGWQAVLEDGYLTAAQARYYYGVWPGIALAAALLWREAPLRAVRPAILLTLALLLLASPALLMLVTEVRGDPPIR